MTKRELIKKPKALCCVKNPAYTVPMAKTYMVLPHAIVEIRLERYRRGVISADAYDLRGKQLRWVSRSRKGTGIGVFGMGENSTGALEHLLDNIHDAMDVGCLGVSARMEKA